MVGENGRGCGLGPLVDQYKDQDIEQLEKKKKKGGEGEWEGMWTRSTCGSVQGSGYKTPEEKRW